MTVVKNLTTKVLHGDARCFNNRGTYSDTVSMAFLDPPYNTGKVFDTYSDRLDTESYATLLEDAFSQAKSALTNNGSVWVTVGGNSTLLLWCTLDRVFGRSNFVADIPWRRNYKATNSSTLSTVHDTILVYSRTQGWRRRNGLTPPLSQLARYTKDDDDGKGPYRLTHGGAKTYASDLIKNGAMPVSWFDYDSFGHNEQGTKETESQCGKRFSYAKPERLLNAIITIATEPGDTVLDSFAGSGTTGVAAMTLSRGFVLVEQSRENIDNFILPRLTKRRKELRSSNT